MVILERVMILVFILKYCIVIKYINIVMGSVFEISSEDFRFSNMRIIMIMVIKIWRVIVFWSVLIVLLMSWVWL